MSQREVLETELRRFHVELSDTQKSTLARYCEELTRWNNKINLTGLKGAELVRRLIVEPVWIGAQLKLGGVLVDVGSGNGSPGVPLHVVSGVRSTHLIEVRAKRVAFLRHVVGLLELKDVTVHRTRVEEIGTEFQNVDWITLQGVALTVDLMESFKAISATTTRVVWITAHAAPPIVPIRSLFVPFTNTEVLVFQLDLS
jgi:16S rRNA (guanine527-N7)-methyltransferase